MAKQQKKTTAKKTTAKKTATKKTNAKAAEPTPKQPRAVVVAGSRTPFVRAFSEFLKLDAVELGVAAVDGLLKKTQLDKKNVDAVVWGGVILPSASPNVGREVAIELGLPAAAEAMTVTRACASGLQAVTSAAALIERGEADVVIAGGGDSTSHVEVQLPNKVVHAFAPLALGKKAGVGDYVKALGKMWPLSSVMPRRPQIEERSTGELMGESAEKMAEINQISRQAQDEFTVQSHQRAAEAVQNGVFANEVAPVTLPNGTVVEKDTILRPTTSVEKLAKLRSAFKENGTLSAGNSSALTDGAAAVLLMSEEKALELGFTPLAYFKSWSYVGVDPQDQLLMGPALAMPKALKRAGLKLEDIDLIDMHEAFAAQVLSVLSMLGSQEFAQERLEQDEAFGDIQPEDLNVYGGSLALGHPFAATGARMVTTMAYELERSGKDTALLGLCAAGGLGAAAVMQRYEASEKDV